MSAAFNSRLAAPQESNMNSTDRTVMRSRRMRLSRLTALSHAALALGLAGCGGSSDSTSAAASTELEGSTTAAAARTEVAQAVETWTRCASEGEICRVPGTLSVRYGIDGAYVYKTVTNAIGCGRAGCSKFRRDF